MSKFTCLILCVVGATLISDHVINAELLTLLDYVKPVLEYCKEFIAPDEDKDKAAVTNAECPTLRDYLKPALECCKEKFKVTDEDIDRAAETGDPNIIPPAYNGCVLQKSGFINQQGEYDLECGLAYLRASPVNNVGQYNKLKSVATICTSENNPVCDENPAWVRAARLSACFLEHKDEADI